MAPVSSIGALNCNISYAACCGLQRILPAPIQSSPPQNKSGTHCNASRSLNVVRQSVPTHLAIHANTFDYDHARRCMVKESVWPFW